MAAAGLRVLAVARKAHATPGDAERRMTLLGLVGIMDPPRPEAAPPSARASTPASCRS